MKLFAKRILLLVANGVSEESVQSLRKGFERESAEVFITTAQPFLVIETVKRGQRGEDIFIDFPVELADPILFDALVIPEGEKSIEAVCADSLALKAVHQFYKAHKPLIVSGGAVRILEEQALYPGQVVVAEGEASQSFLNEAIEAISYHTSTNVDKILVI